MKFKVGQFVKCIDKGTKGSGWKNGLRFKVTRIADGGGATIYFGGEGSNGVFENSLVSGLDLDMKKMKEEMLG